MSADSDAVADIFSHENSGISSQVTGLTKQYTSSIDGVIVTRTKAIADRVRAYDKQIESMQSRIDKYEERLRAQFAAMEKLVSGLQAQGNQLTAAAKSSSS